MYRPDRQCARPKCENNRRRGYQLCEGCSDYFFTNVADVVYFMMGKIR